MNVVDYRTLQTLIHNKSFDQRVEPLDAIRDLVFVQRRDELLYRVSDYRFRDWIDIKHDRDIVNGRLLHNRVGYTHRDQIPLLLGLGQSHGSVPWRSSCSRRFPPQASLGQSCSRCTHPARTTNTSRER